MTAANNPSGFAILDGDRQSSQISNPRWQFRASFSSIVSTGDLMKGPGFRRNLDMRRQWRCPNCGDECRLPGDCVAMRCRKCADHPWMQIVAERNAVPRPSSLMSAPEIPVAEFHLTEEELATPLPGRVRRRTFSRGGNDAPPPDAGANPPAGRNEQGLRGRQEPVAESAPESLPDSRPPKRRKERRPRPVREDQATPLADGSSPAPAAPGDDVFGAGLE